MHPIKALRRYLQNAEKQTQLLAEIRDGIAKQTEILNLRTRDIATQLGNQQENASDSRPSNPRSQDHSMPPVPQISLSRPDPVADLISSQEFPAYVEFFGQANAKFGPEILALITALARKMQPEHGLVFGEPDSPLIAAIAQIAMQKGSGTVHMNNGEGILADLPGELAEHIHTSGDNTMQSILKSKAAPFQAGMIICHEAVANTISQLLEAVEKVAARGAFCIIGNADSNDVGGAIARFVADRPNIQELGTTLHRVPENKITYFSASTIRSRGIAVLRFD